MGELKDVLGRKWQDAYAKASCCKQRNFIMKRTFGLMIVGTVLLLLSNAPTHAEGGNKRATGDWGINRRVLTPTGYAEVGGNFSMSFGIPLGVSGALDDWNTNQDSPTFYLGGHGNYKTNGEAEVDAGLQYDAAVDSGRKRGMWCFLRNTNPDTTGNFSDQYCSLQYYDDVLHASVLWTSGIDTSGGSNAKSFQPLSYSASLNYQIDEKTGIMSLGYDGLGATQAASGGSSGIYVGNGRIYWAAPGSKSDVYSTLQSDASKGSNQIVVTDNNSFSDLSLGTPLSIGNGGDPTFESKIITAIDKASHTIALDSPLSFAHNSYTPISWQLTCRVAHSSVNRAPWAGSATFNTDATDSWHVKRVVGMTRKSGNGGDSIAAKMTFSSRLDGSWVGCTFSGGSVRRVAESASHAWGIGDVDQSTHQDLNDTGYDARANPANGQDAELQRNPALVYDQRISTRAHPMPPDSGGEKSARSRTIVEFTNLDVGNTVARGNSLQSQQAKDSTTHESRYSRETVQINLRKLAGVNANPVAPTQ